MLKSIQSTLPKHKLTLLILSRTIYLIKLLSKYDTLFDGTSEAPLNLKGLCRPCTSQGPELVLRTANDVIMRHPEIMESLNPNK
jgi:hypothetical protein